MTIFDYIMELIVIALTFLMLYGISRFTHVPILTLMVGLILVYMLQERLRRDR